MVQLCRDQLWKEGKERKMVSECMYVCVHNQRGTSRTTIFSSVCKEVSVVSIFPLNCSSSPYVGGMTSHYSDGCNAIKRYILVA